MLTFDVKRKINTLRDILVGKVPDPKAQVEQITIALIYKFMDDMDIEGVEFGGNREFFTGDYEKYAFSKIMNPENSGQERAILYAEGIDKMALNPQLPQLFRDIFRGAYLPYRDPETLNLFLKEIAEFKYDNSEDLGNAFEYLLSIMGSQGDAGQFRTPRHIIDMIVKIVDPKKNETILDPACGTAGFLISAYKHILESNKDEDGNSTLTADDRKRLTNNFEGYDISPDMVRLSRVNMYLHHFTKPKISEYDTLTSEDKWEDNFDVILANPPFMTPKGGIIPHGRYRVKAKRAEVLFVDYIAEHLNPNGRAGIIVPEGIVFQNATAYRELRKYLVDENLLYAVISLPAGVFNPYSGVKTSILLIDRALAKQNDSILFVKLNNDGYDLGAQRREIKGSEIPDIINIFKSYKAGNTVAEQKNVISVLKSDVAKQDYILVGERYKTTTIQSSKWPMVKLGDITEVVSGNGFPKELQGDENGEVPFYKVSDMNLVGNESSMFASNNYVTHDVLRKQNWKLVSSNTVIFPKIGAAIATNKKRMLTTESLFDNNVMGLVCSDQVDKRYLYYILQSIDLSQWASESNPPSIRKTTVEQFAIPLPPISIQQEFIEEIELYQKIIDGARQVVENYTPQFAIDPEWKSLSIGDLCELTYGYTDTAKESGDARFIRITDIDKFGQLKKDEIKYVSLTEENSKYLLKPNDILVARTGATFGKTLLFKEEYPSVFASFLIKIDFDYTLLDPFFCWSFMQTKAYWDQANALVTGGGQPQFNSNAIKQIKIPVPPMAVQEKIVLQIKEELSIVESNKRLIEIFTKKIFDKISEIWGENNA